ncbi:MAG: DUF4292 domain-containing protein [Bacteroidota bacterium]
MSSTRFIILIIAGLLLTQCRAYREVTEPKAPPLVGMEGLREVCRPADTVRTVLISKAEALIITDEERYEATISLFVIKDSLIYFSAVNSGFEILRAAIDRDTIKVIDRLNKMVYRTPLRRRFGHHHPVNFDDVQNIISSYFLCDEIERAIEPNFFHIVFDFDEPFIKKRISFDRESLKMDKFEFFHIQTKKYLMGEREPEGFRIFTNFMITDFEISARGGFRSYNQEIPVKMEVNRRKYTFVDL